MENSYNISQKSSGLGLEQNRKDILGEDKEGLESKGDIKKWLEVQKEKQAKKSFLRNEQKKQQKKVILQRIF